MRSVISQAAATALATAVAFAPAAGFAQGQVLRGQAVVIDGQTLEVEARRVTLHGVLAPPVDMNCHTKRDKPYPCGRLARQALADIVKSEPVECFLVPELTGMSPGGPAWAKCQIGPFSVNEMIISTGRVLARPGVAARYDLAGRTAQLLGEGLWKGRYPPPAEWR